MAVSLLNSRSAVAVGDYGVVYYTENAGRDWRVERYKPDGYSSPSLEEVFEADRWARQEVLRWSMQSV